MANTNTGTGIQYATSGGLVTPTNATLSVTPAGRLTFTKNENYYDYFLCARRRYLLEINKIYLLSYAKGKIRKVKFISSTPRGFNFVDIETERLIFKRHIYRCRTQEHKGYTAQQSKDDFWVWMDGKINVALPFEEQVIDD